MAYMAPPATMKTPVRAALRGCPGPGIPRTLFLRNQSWRHSCCQNNENGLVGAVVPWPPEPPAVAIFNESNRALNTYH
jgi:hypothetical protein